MPQLDDRLTRLAEARPPVGAGVLIQRIENRIADTPVRRVSPAVHPIRAMTMAALAVLVFVGGVAVGHWAFGSVGLFGAAFGGAAVWTTTEDISVLAMVVAGAGGGVVLLAGSLGLAWRGRRRRQIYRSSTDQGGIMETMDKTIQTFDSTERVLRINRWMAVALILALAALVALGAWLLVGQLATSDMERLADDAYAAMNEGNVDAWMDLHSTDAVQELQVVGWDSDTRQGGEELRAWFQRYAAMGDGFRNEITGEPVIAGDHVAFPSTLAWGESYFAVEMEGIHVMRIEDGLIAESVFIGSEFFQSSGP